MNGKKTISGRLTKDQLRIILVAFFVLRLSTLRVPAVFAQGGPPLITDDPGTSGDGNWEINIAFAAEKRRTEGSYESPILDINYGIGERIQLKYEVPWLVLDESGQRTINGLGNSVVGVKWRFFDEDRQRIDMSIYPQFEFNNSDSSADRGLVDKGFGIILPVQWQESFGSISFNPEFGYAINEYNDNEWIYGLAVGYEASSNLELLAEISGTTGQDFEDDELVLNLGARCGLSVSHTLLLSAGRGFHSAASGEPEFLLYTGIQFIF